MGTWGHFARYMAYSTPVMLGLYATLPRAAAFWLTTAACLVILYMMDPGEPADPDGV